MSEPFIGEIKIVAFSYAPRNWAMCDGQLMDINQNPTLFALINSFYGGDGRTTMALPDLRGRMAIHNGSGPGRSLRRLGEFGGFERIVLHEAQMPAHTHSSASNLVSKTPVSLNSGNTNTPNADNTSVLSGNVVSGLTPVNIYGDTPTNSLEPTIVEGNVSIGNTGGGQSHENMPPFLALNFIIALEGVFPPRN